MFLAGGTDVISERKAKRQDLTFNYLMEQMKKHNIHIDNVDKLCENYKLKDDDRLEVFSYGELPYFLDLEAFYSGKSMPINEALFKIFLINEFSE